MERAFRHAHRKLTESGAASVEEAQEIFGALLQRPAAGDDDAPTSPLDQAQELADAATDAAGRNQIRLARQALAISRDCADAWALLASRKPYPNDAIPLLREAVAAGERALGPAFVAEHTGQFWGFVETRPYMRAKHALADALDAAGQINEAIAQYSDMIRLNPGDNQGIRYSLLRLLLEGNRDQEAAALIEQMREDEGASWLYGGALVAFRLRQADADTRLARARAENRHVVAFLTGQKKIPALPDSYRPGSVDEAAIAAESLVDAWRATPGAVEWLTAQRRAKQGGGRKRR
jgi:tetratricopeptide (TPR) repeat protein